MAAKRRGAEATTRPDPSHAQHTSTQGERSTPDAKRTTVSVSAASNPRGFAYRCPVCDGGSGTADYMLCRDGRWAWLISCWTFDCQEMGGAYLRELAECAEAPGGGHIKDDPEHWLGPFQISVIHAQLVAGGDPPPLPDCEWFRTCHVNLRRRPAVARYLVRERQLSSQVLRSMGVGWDVTRREYTFPFISDDGFIDAYKTRKPGDGQQMKNCAGKGRPWPLYGAEYAEPGKSAVLVAGELDALRGISAGLRTYSVPLGAGLWREHWADELRGLEVGVCFDNNEVPQARKVVAALKTAGIDAYRIDLRKHGMTGEKDDLSDYLNADNDADRLRRRARRTR